MSTEIQERLAKLERRVAKLENHLDGAEIVPFESELEELLSLVSPSTHAERATTIGFWLVHERKEDSFSSRDIEAAYEECRLTKPANMSDVLAGAEEKGWLMRHSTKGQKQLWIITREGDEAVNGGFSG